ncbi:MAG: hypothetical protein DME50_18440 [Verrucomicrobia bacterium]|nr:MAG: hypothetical protein DME50_18440 [Verrucomicrobiota bacterium]
MAALELRLAYRAARLAEEGVVIDVRVKRRIEIDKMDTRIGELAPVARPLQIVADHSSSRLLNALD